MSTTHATKCTYIILTIVTYSASFVLPLEPGFFGIQAFVLGFLHCLLVPWIGVPWLANVALWVGLYQLNLERWNEAKWCGVIALGLGLLVPPLCWNYHIPGIGYHVWLCSMGVLARGAIRSDTVERRERGERKRIVRERRLQAGNLEAVGL